ncbi:MAG: site-2 protease family protein [Planctomycetaceae bacterium]
MFGQQFPPTEYDLRFSVTRVPVRVHPVFWLTAAWISWHDRQLDLTLIGMLCVFVSILLHELGHAWMTRRLGNRRPEIVLEFFGGYATTGHHTRWGNIAVAAAGPGAGLLLFGALWLWTQTDSFHLLKLSRYPAHAIGNLILMNWSWSLMNLVPVWPLDGGQIARQLIGFQQPHLQDENTTKLSIAVAVGMVAWSVFSPGTVMLIFWNDPKFFVFFFGYLAFLNYQSLRSWSRPSW